MTDEKALRLMCVAKAASMWKELPGYEKGLVRFGMFPAEKMQAAIKEGYDSRMLSVALMDEAQKDGGMRA